MWFGEMKTLVLLNVIKKKKIPFKVCITSLCAFIIIIHIFYSAEHIE